MKLYNLLLISLILILQACSYENLDETITNPGEVDTEIIECSIKLDLTQNPSDSELSVIAEFGTPPYSYKWSSGDETASIKNISPGSYSVGVEDIQGCISSKTLSWDVELDCDGPFGLLVSLDINAMKLNADVKSNSQFSLLWSTGNTDNMIPVESGQTYTVEVINQAGCILITSYDVP